MPHSLSWLLALGVTAASCQCGPRLTTVEDSLRVSPERLSLAPTRVGTRSAGTLTVTNTSSTTLELDLSIDAPFTVDVAHLTLGGAEERTLELALTPDAVASFSATLHVGALEVPVDGSGLEAPSCPQPSAACHIVSFDVATGACVERTADDSTACETSCLRGACRSGVCVGALKACDSGNACLIGTCSETDGCGVVPRECPAPTSACQVAACDPTTGCKLEHALDGTVCGQDDCFSAQVDVCMAGQCVPRPRPVTARCSNRWVPDGFSTREDAALAYDPVRKHAVLFGGRSFGDTWTFDGQRWEQRWPANSPPPRAWHSMTWDGRRKRVLLFGGRDAATQTVYADTWEWDGVTWVQRFPTVSPPAAWVMSSQQLAFDEARGRAVLYLGAPMSAGATWEWDGAEWSRRQSAVSPPADQAYSLAWDGTAQRVVLFGGVTVFSTYFNDTWEWDGTTWTRRSTPLAPTSRAFGKLSWDPNRRRLVLFGGASNATDTWEHDGTQWLQRTPAHSPPRAIAATLLWDSAHQRTLLVDPAAGSAWTWDGTDWTELASPTRPPYRFAFTLTTDTARQRVVLFGGGTGLGTDSSETWEWNGTWTLRLPPTSPPPRSAHAAAYDPVRQRVVVFGGWDNPHASALNDLWEWDGTTWTERHPTTSPLPTSGAAMTWDPVSQRVLLFCAGSSRNDVWAWDGVSWVELVPATWSSGAFAGRLVVDPVHQNVLRFDGSTSWWNGSGWTAHAPASPPPAHFVMDLAPDPPRGRVVHSVRGQSWLDGYRTSEWDGAQWTQRQLATELPGSTGDVQLAWDPVKQRVMAVLGDTTWHLLP